MNCASNSGASHTIREAIRMLTVAGMVSRAPGRGRARRDRPRQHPFHATYFAVPDLLHARATPRFWCRTCAPSNSPGGWRRPWAPSPASRGCTSTPSRRRTTGTRRWRTLIYADPASDSARRASTATRSSPATVDRGPLWQHGHPRGQPAVLRLRPPLRPRAATANAEPLSAHQPPLLRQRCCCWPPSPPFPHDKMKPTDSRSTVA